MKSVEFVRESVLQMQANADFPLIHTVTRNDRVYDRMCPLKYATTQITHSYARDMSGLWRLWDEKGEIIAEFQVTTTKG